MPHVADALDEFPCGPTGHRFDRTGIFIGDAAGVSQLSPLPPPNRELTACAGCGKEGGPHVCSFCSERPRVLDELRSPEGITLKLALCSLCHLGFIHHEDTRGWEFVRSVRS